MAKRVIARLATLLLLSAAAYAEEPAPAPVADAEAPPAKAAVQAEEGEKVISGMSIVGNDEAPKSLVIVPWKSAELGNTLDVSRALDDGRGPVDRDVFMRELTYYEIRTGRR